MQIKSLILLSLAMTLGHSAIAMEKVKTIQTRKVKEHWLTPTTNPTEIEYKDDSQDPACKYIQDTSKIDPELQNFLDKNKDAKILLVGVHSLRIIDHSLIPHETKPTKRCTIL